MKYKNFLKKNSEFQKQEVDWSQVDYEKLAAFDIYEYKGKFQRVCLGFLHYFGAYLTDIEV